MPASRPPLPFQASYFFGGAVKQAKVTWTVYSDAYTFTYDDGKPWSFSDFKPDVFYQPIEPTFRQPIASGEGQTDDQGQFALSVPTDLLGQTPESELRTVEFTVVDANDQSVSGSAALVVHAAGVYPGIRPASYVGVAGEAQTALLIAVDALARQPVAGQQMTVEVSEAVWRTVRQQDENGRQTFVSKVEETPVVQGQVTTGADGLAQFEWTPTAPGQYLIRATARDAMGNAKRSAAWEWIAGPEYAPWRVTNDDRIDLVTDKKNYEVGDTARVLVTSPFRGQAEALITIERAGILRHEVRMLATNSETLEIPILPEYAPNVFVSVVLVNPPVGNESPTFKMGLAQLNVNPQRHLLNLDIQA